MLLYPKSRMYAQIAGAPVGYVVGHGRNTDNVGLILALAVNVESVSERLSITLLDGSLSGAGQTTVYTIDFRLDGDRPDLAKAVRMINSGKLFDLPDSLKAPVAAATRTLHVDPSKRRELYVRLTETDKPGIVREFATAALPGSISGIHCEVQNSGRFAGTADFVLVAKVGFASEADSEAALLRFQGLMDPNRPERSVKVWRLYEVGGQADTNIPSLESVVRDAGTLRITDRRAA